MPPLFIFGSSCDLFFSRSHPVDGRLNSASQIFALRQLMPSTYQVVGIALLLLYWMFVYKHHQKGPQNTLHPWLFWIVAIFNCFGVALVVFLTAQVCLWG